MFDFVLKLLGPNAWVTIIRYALTALGGFIIAKGWVPAENWDEIAGAVLVIVTTLFGAGATVTPKVVTQEGQTVLQKDMPPVAKAQVEHAAAETLAK